VELPRTVHHKTYQAPSLVSEKISVRYGSWIRSLLLEWSRRQSALDMFVSFGN